MSKKITRIEPEAALPTSPDDFCGRKEKVAAYARVSTDHKEQATSLMAQTDYYKKKILANPSWEFAGIYADDGVSGTSAHLRESFNRMMQDCREGKITMILTKSISRFARNTVDSIKYIRELRSLGIGVMFEKENIWSLDSKGESVPTDLIQNHYRPLGEKPLLYKGRAASRGFLVCINFAQMLRCTRSIRIQNHTPLTIAFYR